MRELSKSLRQRLGARPQPQTHPDPDVLNAYMERVLPVSERDEVVVHLAECSYCRDVISVSLAQMQSTPAPQNIPTPSRFWIPAFRWAAAMAVLAVAATLMIEKPWQWRRVDEPRVQQVSQVQQIPSPAASAASTASTPTLPGTAGGESSLSSSIDSSSRQSRVGATGVQDGSVPVHSATSPEQRGQTGVAARPKALGAAEAVKQGALVPFVNQTEIRTGSASGRPATAAVAGSESPGGNSKDRDSDHDYLNTRILSNDAASPSRVASNSLPPAPLPQSGQVTTADGKKFPLVPLDAATNHAFDVSIAPPNTSPGPTSDSRDTTFTKSRFLLTVPRKIVSTLEKAGSVGQQTIGARSFSGGMLVRPSAKTADTENETKEESRPQFRISDGTLMRSTDSTQWHEAYPQTSDLQLKVLVTRGEQVWAGGNNATLIHSWNAGVNWETLKVPDSGDITAITVDDGWQVKTSNGQTFVSQDHGKTWVPLQAEPK